MAGFRRAARSGRPARSGAGPDAIGGRPTGADAQWPPELSYAYRDPASTTWRSRAGITSLLFSGVMGVSYLLGRKRP